MNDKINRIYEEEKVVCLSDLCFYVLGKWKLMLVAAVVLAVVSFGLFSYKNYQSYQESKHMTAEDELKQLGVSEEQKEIVHMKLESFANHKETIKEYEDYYSNSIKVRLDPNHVKQGIASYVIAAENAEDVLKTIAICENKLFSEDAYMELAAQLSEPADVAMLKEVIKFERFSILKDSDTAENVSAEENAVGYEIVVRHFNENDCETMLTFMEERMELLPEMLAAENVNVQFSKIAVKLEEVCDRSITTLSRDVRNNMQTSYEYITATKNGLKEEQKVYYDYLMAKESNPESGVAEKSLKDFLDVKMAVVGALAGAMLAAAVYVAIYLLDKTVHNKEELQSWISTPVIDLNAGTDLMLTYVAGIVTNHEVKQVCLTGTKSRLNETVMQQVKSMLEEKGCEVVCGDNILTDAKTLQNATECGHVILFEKCHVSKQKDVKDALMKASSCGIYVLSVVLEK